MTYEKSGSPEYPEDSEPTQSWRSSWPRSGLRRLYSHPGTAHRDRPLGVEVSESNYTRRFDSMQYLRGARKLWQKWIRKYGQKTWCSTLRAFPSPVSIGLINQLILILFHCPLFWRLFHNTLSSLAQSYHTNPQH